MDVTKSEIRNAVVNHDAAVSARWIADRFSVESTSENLHRIKDTCFELVEAGELVSLTAANDGCVFFGAA